jgi:hypothetical protein
MQTLLDRFSLHKTAALLTILVLVYPSISLAEKNTPSPKENSEQAVRFVDNGNGTVTDTKTKLMWAAKDNGKDIDFHDAEVYCNSFSAGGYTDWRMPDIEELENLYEADSNNKSGFKITGLIQLSSCCPWSSYDSFGSSSAFNFKKGRETWGFKTDTQLFRALPVREIN